MIGDVNFLPEKEPRNIAPWLLFIILIVLAIGVLLYGYIQYQDKKENISSIEAKITKVKETRESLNVPSWIGEYHDLKNAVNWSESRKGDLNLLLTSLVEELPQNGYIEQFYLDDYNVLSLEIQLENHRDAAFYLQNLKDSSLVEKASLLSINTSNVTEEVERQDGELSTYQATYSLIIDLEKLKKQSEKQEETE
jgi:type IV pilus assembly protein PilN